MATIEIIAGDIPKQKASISFRFGATLTYDAGGFKTDLDFITEVDRLEVHTEETLTKLKSAAGWGLLGGAIAGPVGLLAGALLKGRKNMVCFAAYTTFDTKFLALADSKTFRKIEAARF